MNQEVKEREFYTQNGWKGEKYESTSGKLSLKEIAQRIKRETLTKHPEITLSVSTRHFSGGCSVEIEVKSFPGKILRRVIDQPFQEKYGNLEERDVPKWVWRYHNTPEAKALLDDIQRIANQYRYSDCDGMIDYFSTNFYCTPDFDYSLRMKEEKELGVC